MIFFEKNVVSAQKLTVGAEILNGLQHKGKIIFIGQNLQKCWNRQSVIQQSDGKQVLNMRRSEKCQ